MSVSVKKETEQRRSTTSLIILVVGIIFLAMNLRAPITAVGPVVPAIRDSLGISNAAIGTLTTIPLLAFAILSPFAPRLARRFGMEMVLFFVLIVLSIGLDFKTDWRFFNPLSRHNSYGCWNRNC